MEYRIALLLKKHYYTQITEEIKTCFHDVDLHFFSYDTLDELNETFLTIKSQFDGFLVSGMIPLQALRITGALDKDTLIDFCPIDIENTYRILLKYLVTVKNLKLSRVGMDFLRDAKTLEDLIRNDQFAEKIHAREERWQTFTSLEELIEEENSITELYKNLYKSDKIDVVITYFYSAVENMKEYDIDCFYVYPSNEMFIQLIETLRKSISLKKLRQSLAAVIHIDMDEAYQLNSHSFEKYQLEMNQIIMEINQQNFNQMIIKQQYKSLELYTDYALVKKLTADFKECQLWSLLHQKLGFNSSIGYGVGSSLTQARLNAIDACHYGRSSASKGGSFLIDSEENLTVLNTEENSPSLKLSEEYITMVSNQVKLSSATIVRIIGVMQSIGSRELTSQDLVNHLNISLRSANKFLSNLERHGYAHVVRQKRNSGKGRPVNIYRLSLDYEQA